MMKVKTLLPLGIIPFIVLYMAYAFVSWDIVWAAHTDTVMRVTFVWLYVILCVIISFFYEEYKDK